MKKIAYFVLTLIVSYSAFASDIDTITQNVKSVCESPTQAGKYWNVTATGKSDAKGSIRLASIGVNGEATFTKGEWEGVQQVLKAQQSADNASYRDCAVKLTPLFLAKFAAPTPAAKATESKHYKPKRPAQNKTAASKSPSAKANGSQQETHGDKSPAIITHGDVNVDIK
ncbi:MAG: hypothetical protein NTX45_00370 [Proteobacteria bacterium]|nr:hypothetical protein [Pseudomonadota bacterium]